MIDKLQYYVSSSLDPYINLATEKHLLDTLPNSCCTLYLWQNQNTVVIGKNQNPWAECNCSLLEAEGGKLARRLSGGGAVFHDIGNLNFTFLCETKHFDLCRQLEVIKTACNIAGIKAEVSGRNDILADGKKFSGNAFYNSKGKSYHHGTILICTDTNRMKRYLTPPKAKLEAKGIKSVKSRVVNLSELSSKLTCKDMAGYMLSAFEKVYGLTAKLCNNTNDNKISLLAKEYSTWEYLYGNTISFTLSCEDQFQWGYIQLMLQVKSGMIHAAQIYTDSMDWSLPEKVKQALTNCRFNLNDIANALSLSLPLHVATDLANLLKKQEL